MGTSMRKGLFWLNDKQWAQIEPNLPTNQTGPAREDDRRIISGIIYMLRRRDPGPAKLLLLERFRKPANTVSRSN